MIYQAAPDLIAATRAKLQIAGVPFNMAQSVKPAALSKAATSDAEFKKLVDRLLPPGPEALKAHFRFPVPA